MKVLNGKELAEFVKERQFQVVRGMAKKPCLVIIRDSDNPVIMKYVQLKMQYGEDIGVTVRDVLAHGKDGIAAAIREANADEAVNGIILQLPILDRDATDELTNLIAPEKDVDGLSDNGVFDSATATAINWLLGGYNIELKNTKIAIIGHGKLVGAPLERMWKSSGFDVTVFKKGDDLGSLSNFDVIVTATGVPHLIKNEHVRGGAVVIDAGTASEDGVLVGDLDDAVRERQDLAAITPRTGGVGPLTVTCLFEHVINA